MRNLLLRFGRYINPIAHLGDSHYSYLFPISVNLLVIFTSEFLVHTVLKDPNAVGIYIIFVNVALILYFAFRDGMLGGVISSIAAVLYYFYIIYTRHYDGSQLRAGIETTLILGLLYCSLGAVVGWLKQTIDGLIEREANEKKRLQTIVSQLPVGVMISDKEGKIVATNKQLETILGIKIPAGTMAGVRMLMPTEYNGGPAKPSDSAIVQALRTGRRVFREFTVIRKKGRRVHLQVSATPIQNKAGKIFAAASIISDVTQQKELEKRKDDFVNMASHELKTPLTSLKLYVHALQNRLKEAPDTKAKRSIDGIKYQTDKLQKLVNDLLDVSRLQTGKLTFTPELFRLDRLVRETVDELQLTTRDHEIRCIGKNALTVTADRFRIYQVISNLITNAIKYSPNEMLIVVRMKVEKGEAIVSVQDQGIGIDKDEQGKVFERLYQVSDNTEQSFPGFGMGLYIAKAIISRHKGRIWVESQKDKGSTFYFSLPLDA